MGLFQNISRFFKAMNGFNDFFAASNRPWRQLVFYAEKGIYYRYYEGLIGAIMERSDLKIAYLTADIEDPIYQLNNPRIKPFYIQNFEAALFPKLDSRAVVMTLPDLNRFYIKKTTNPGVNHIYVFHAVGSTHLQYNFGAFDHYDTIFCVGPHHETELRKAEELYGLPPKTMVRYGYPYLEQVYQVHQDYSSRNAPTPEGRKTVLIAPTWGANCILETCIDEIAAVLSRTEFNVVVRPHPEFCKRRPQVINKLKKSLAGSANIRLELDLVSGLNVHNTDILITDWSGIGFEFAFGTERPVLFIDTPLKIDNPKYQELGLEPLEVFSRNQIGKSLPLDKITEIGAVLTSFIADFDKYRAKIVEFRKQYVYNWQSAAAVGADYIIDLCNKP
jgi:YidC/Oxa1 family membrane protein insertase